ncbi:DUF4245 family protein [Microbacterium sp. ASV49]|uniref:DUF4245 family protein n=1 Tax=Microbacterium candidum TaxID=3041922 RepID=A0ABT7N242_9MICO|nr:DUF4245 family protein [Microbacterium sp. ASV49]MDL9980781.1 DUF4245 family protein [Microbacterium sp. ASV49]
MASGPRIVAELGRPETPDETAARKAESSRIYRSSQTFRNLIAALLATLGVVLVIALSVPRGDPGVTAPVDAVAVAKQVQGSYDRPVVVAKVPASWRVNSAAVDGDETWTVAYAPKTDPGFVRVSQGFGADTAWDAQLLKGAAPSGTTDIDGITWTVYDIPDPARAGNVSYAIGTQAGKDRILIYGSASPATTAIAAKGLADQIRSMNGASR